MTALPSPTSTRLEPATGQAQSPAKEVLPAGEPRDATGGEPFTSHLDFGAAAALNRQDEERLIHLYYVHFAPFHNILVPHARFASQNYPPYLRAVVYLIGSQFTSGFSSVALRATADALLDRGQDASLSFVQASLLHAITLHARADRVSALTWLSRASDVAIQLGLNQRNAASAFGGQDVLLQESVRRTWWELYVVDGYLAAVHRQTDFRCNKVTLDAALPCEEAEYREGMASPESTTLEDFDSRFFSDVQMDFASACYRVETIRILARVLALTSTMNNGPDDVQSVDNAIRAWKLHLIDSKAIVTDRFGSVDHMMLQAFAFIHAATIILHFPRSELLLRVPTATDIECASAMIPESPTSAQHATKAIAASKEMSDLATLPVCGYSPFLACGLVFGCIVQLSACSAHSHSCLIQHRDRVALMTGALKSLSRSWPIAGHALQKLNAIAAGVFKTGSMRHASGQSSFSSQPSPSHDSGVDIDAMLKELCEFDLFPPGVAADDFAFNPAGANERAVR